VTAADGSNKAVEWLGNNRPNVVLVHEMLSGAPGIELIRHIRSMPRFSTTAVIAFVNDGYAEDAAYEAGADLCLEKPVEAETLLELISEVQATMSSRV
jgi:CheY-like chemotaxis protein